VVLVLGACLAGCSTGSVYNIKVNGFTSPEQPAQIKPGGRFYVMADKAAKNPLLEAEVRDKIVKLLESHGYPVTDYERADYYLFFTYGLGEPRSLSAAVPEYIGTFGWGWGCGWGGPSMAVIFPPYASETITLYDRWLQLNVVDGPDYRSRQASKSVWVGEARSTGSSSDLRTVLNYLLVADFQEFGKNTGKAIIVELKEQDPAIYSLTH
jgi:hypothetical protein